MMIFGNITNTTYRFSCKQYNLFYTIQKREICPFMETVPFGCKVLIIYYAKSVVVLVIVVIT